MEYGNDFKSKYTTLHISTTLYWKKMNEKQKMTWTQIPPRGMGNGLERAYSELFLLPAVKISANWYDASLFLYRMKPRAYKVKKLKISENGETPEGSGWPKSHFSDSTSSSFLLYLIKISKFIKIKYAQNYFESTFGSTHF